MPGISYADVVRESNNTFTNNVIKSNNETNSEHQYKRLEDLIIKQLECSAKQQEENKKLVEQLSVQVSQLLGVITALIPKLCK